MRPQQRAALVAWYLARGSRLRTCEIARLVGLSERGALDLMWLLSGTLPIYQDRGIWREVDAKT